MGQKTLITHKRLIPNAKGKYVYVSYMFYKKQEKTVLPCTCKARVFATNLEYHHLGYGKHWGQAIIAHGYCLARSGDHKSECAWHAEGFKETALKELRVITEANKWMSCLKKKGGKDRLSL